MNQFQESGELLRKEPLSPGVWRLTIRAPEIARTARPGQFVMVRTGEGCDPLLRRPLSIHQTSGDGTVQLLFKVVGKGTARLAEITIGRQLNLVGPLGRGFETAGRTAICLVGGGMGIAPLYFLARELLRFSQTEPPFVFLGARTRSELSRLAEDFVVLGVRNLQLATDDGSMGHHGLVTDLLARQFAGAEHLSVCTCGPQPMMRAVAGLCRSKGWSCQVSLETMMACGIGACLGCAVSGVEPDGDYLHVCKDGPVFQADRLGW